MKMNIDKEIVKSVLLGDHSDLGNAFSWKDTPQGHGYWHKRYTGEIPINDEDRTFLRKLIESTLKEILEGL